MSLYASLAAPGDGHPVTCAVYAEEITGSGVYGWSGKPCDCGLPDAPIIYRGSHVLPSAADERGGAVDLALIPGYIGEGNQEADTHPAHPFLRLGVNGEAVVLDRRGVELVHRTLGEWLGGLG